MRSSPAAGVSKGAGWQREAQKILAYVVRVCLASCSFSQEEPGFLPGEVPSPDAKRGGRPTLLPPRKPFKPCENLGPGPRHGVQYVAHVGGGELGPQERLGLLC